MGELLAKISSYNLFNYLLPGVIFCTIEEQILQRPLVTQELVAKLFIYYFWGLVVSRFGSIALDPLLKRSSFIIFSQYKDYVAASKNDKLIVTLSEVNNTYRTLSSLFCLIIMLSIYAQIETKFQQLRNLDQPACAILLLLLFLLSYRKQTSYITKRVQGDRQP
jgi:hypothetical protein